MKEITLNDPQIIQFFQMNPEYDPNIFLKRMIDLYQYFTQNQMKPDSNFMLQQLNQSIHQAQSQLMREIPNLISSNPVMRQSVSLIQDLSNKMLGSFHKGRFGENNLESKLVKIFHDGVVINLNRVGLDIPNGDFLLKWKNENILIETKSWQNTVAQEELDKFKRDVLVHKTGGVFFSHSSGIVNMDGLHFELVFDEISGENFPAVYIPNCQFDEDKIKLSIQLCLHLITQQKEIQRKLNLDSPFQFEDEEMDIIRDKFNDLVKTLKIMKKNTEDYYKKQMHQYDSFCFDVINDLFKEKMYPFRVEEMIERKTKRFKRWHPKSFKTDENQFNSKLVVKSEDALVYLE